MSDETDSIAPAGGAHPAPTAWSSGADVPPPPPAPPAPPAPADRTARLRSLLPRTAVLRALLVAVVHVGAALVVAFAVALLLLVGIGVEAATHPSTAGGTGGALPSGTGSAAALQVSGSPLVALLMLVVAGVVGGVATGSLALDQSSPLAALGLTDASGSIASYVPLVGLVVPVLVTTAPFTRWRTPAPAPRLPSRLLEGAVVALAAGVVMELLALLGSASITVSGVSASLSAAGPAVFLGTALGAFAAHQAGGALAAALPGRALPALRALPARLPRLAGGPVIVLGVWAVLCTVVAFIAVVVDALVSGAPGGVFAAPALAGSVAVAIAALGQFGALQTSADLRFGSMSQSSSAVSTVFHSGQPWLLLWVLTALVAAVASAVLLPRLRPAGERRPLWLLPAAALVGWLVLPAVLAVAHASGSISASAAATSLAGQFSYDLGVAWWTAPIAAVWGLGIEALARFAVPAWADRRSASGARARLLSIVGIVAVLAIAGVGSAVAAVVDSVFSPAAAARGYLDDLAAGRTAAASLGHRLPALPGDAADRLRVVRVGDADRSGDTAEVPVTFSVRGQRFEREVTLRRSGTTAGVFPKWVVSTPLTTDVEVDESISGAVTVGGAGIASSGGIGTATLLPGAYPVAVAGAARPYVATSVSTLVAGSSAETDVTETTTPALRSAVTAKLRDDLNTCLASTEAAPADCPFATYPFGQYSGLTWSLDSDPTLQLDGLRFATTGGAVTARYRLQDFFGSGTTAETDHVSIYPVFGTVTIGADGLTVTYD